ncbi:scavenger receptor cysteine-rich type 1 protein M130-like isoform X2 [Misgurnus anguillicaudatus]|uniref:scavenger receptor cysteine-rich type 1 protein M130-like isoform X2 n=1 Tax=Misgurnus anguillicaudatus TaxID=75329 RepID=UPI002434DBC1|nr:deleted in malignant brain tumors 1 protein-like isoform X2 [Misgurnus anguillicaudatus]
MDNVHCKGSEPTLRECRFNGWGINNCDHSYDAGVICRDVRLINGSNLCSGRVEVLYNDEWGTVCDAGWDLTDAAVVCNSMDCGTPVAVMTAAYFGQGSGPVWLDDLSCSGYELSVKDCLSIPLGTSTCSHGRDAGVVCRDIRLVNGMGPCDGKVEVLYDDHWGGVCHTGFDVKAASVVCQELGCENTGEPLSYMGPFDGPIWMGNLACAGNELTLRDCSFTGWGVSSCVNDLHAGVICNKIMRQGVVRITVTADAGVDVSNPDIIKKLLDKISKVVKGQGDYLTNWKTQPNGNVFQEIPTLQVVTECNKDQ